MKYIFPLCILAFACGQSKNDLMTKFLNEKKIMTDSISYYQNAQSYYKDQAKRVYDENNFGPSTLYIDSGTKAFMNEHNATARIKELDFSIDSLSKMK